MSEKILLLPGDGIGPRVMSPIEEILPMLTDSVEIVRGEIGRTAYEATGQYLPHETLDLLDECKVIFAGPISVPAEVSNPLTTLMAQLNLYARYRLFKTLSPDLGEEGLEIELWSSNNIVSEEITEVPDMDGVTLSKYVKNDAYSMMMTQAISSVEQRRLSRIACLTREDFFPVSSGMFAETFDTLFQPDIYETRTLNVKDWIASSMKNRPEEQCILCVDLYSQIVASVLAGLTGFDHMTPSCLMSDEYRMYYPFRKAELSDIEPGYENPTSAVMSLVMHLRHLGLEDEANLLLKALGTVYAAGERTPDTGGTLKSDEFLQCILRHI